MKQGVVIVVGAIVLVIAVAKDIYDVFDGIDKEMLRYVSNLNYDFTAKVDSVVVLKKGGGYLLCELTSGQCSRLTEDSLNHHLINFKRIRFLHFRSDDKFLIILGGANKFRPTDSVVVNSKEDQFLIYRNGEPITNAKVSLNTRHKVSFAFWIKD
jgi:hypothetical protein